MQLEKIVAYHKALSDPTRIKMLVLIAQEECSGQRLAERLGVTPATITHHAAKLREAALINERRDKNTIYFSLNDYFMKTNATATFDFIYRQAAQKEDSLMQDPEALQKYQQSVINNFFTADGRLKTIPAQLKKKLIVLEHLVSRLEHRRKYTEPEINAFIRSYHDDFATLRREFVMQHFMYRENSIYELNPPEMWASWRQLK
ncbi:metalloregulator ArsR/SmtB family transcription factor [Paenibacillus thiaminolyticus]|uniref:DUF2087 domain-containing protein n=1 Tax=Paenibacillus thiaminolyticus TaxID=49283 RepID=UPI003D2D2412